MNVSIEYLPGLPNMVFESRRKLLLQLKTIEKAGPRLPVILADEHGNSLVFGDSRILVRPWSPPESEP